MSRTPFAIVASAVIATGCANPSPTAPADPSATQPGGTLSTLDAGACVARSILAVYTPNRGRHLITVVFLDAMGNDVVAIGCPALAWSVSPQGARIQPLSEGSGESNQGELIVTGALQTYTVTVTSGTMASSVQVLAGP